MPKITEFASNLPPEKPRGKYQLEAADLRARPGEWGKVGVWPKDKYTTARSTAINIQNGKLVAFRPKGTFEAATRKTRDGIVIWARYVGGKHER